MHHVIIKDMITYRFPYQKIDRKTIDGKRYYLTPDNQKVPSVTTIIEATKPIESVEALKNWRKRIGYANAINVTKEAASRGTRMHKFLENFVINDDPGDPGTNPYSKESYNMALQIIEKGLCNVKEFYGTEIQLYWPSLYAGTTDLVCQLKTDEDIVIDYKQSNKPKKEAWIDSYKCQLVSYGLAHNNLYNTNIRRGIVMICTKDLELQQFEITPEDFDYWADAWWNRVAQFFNIEFI
jgi:hypothetical protein